MVALVADLGDVDPRRGMGGEQPADADVGLRAEPWRRRRIEAGRRLEHRRRERGRLREVDHVAGVHPAAGEVDRMTL